MSRVVASRHIERGWLVLESVETAEHDRCVDIFARTDGSFGFEEFRRDVEDRGAWTPVAWHAATRYPTRDAAVRAALSLVSWLAGVRCGTS